MIDDTLYDAFGQRQVSTIFTQLNQYHVVLEVAPAFQENPEALKSDLREVAAGRPGAAERVHALLSRRARRRSPSTTRGSSRRSRCPSTWRPASSLGARRHAPSRQPSARSACPPRCARASRARRRPSRPSLANEPLLILAALVTVYIVLGILYESYIHPVTILSTLPSAGWARSWPCSSAAPTST